MCTIQSNPEVYAIKSRPLRIHLLTAGSNVDYAYRGTHLIIKPRLHVSMFPPDLPKCVALTGSTDHGAPTSAYEANEL